MDDDFEATIQHIKREMALLPKDHHSADKINAFIRRLVWELDHPDLARALRELGEVPR